MRMLANVQILGNYKAKDSDETSLLSLNRSQLARNLYQGYVKAMLSNLNALC